MAQTDRGRCLNTLKISLERCMKLGLRPLAIGFEIGQLDAQLEKMVKVIKMDLRDLVIVCLGVLEQVWSDV